MTDRLAQIAIPVADLDAAAAFYGDRLGWTELFRAPNVIAYGFATDDAADGIRALLTHRPGYAAPADTQFLFYLDADDIEARHAALVASGAADGGEPHMIADLGHAQVWIAFVKDPSGNLIGLIEEKPAS